MAKYLIIRWLDSFMLDNIFCKELRCISALYFPFVQTIDIERNLTFNSVDICYWKNIFYRFKENSTIRKIVLLWIEIDKK